jgi:hypothetical protein
MADANYRGVQKDRRHGISGPCEVRYAVPGGSRFWGRIPAMYKV